MGKYATSDSKIYFKYGFWNKGLIIFGSLQSLFTLFKATPGGNLFPIPMLRLQISYLHQGQDQVLPS